MLSPHMRAFLCAFAAACASPASADVPPPITSVAAGIGLTGGGNTGGVTVNLDTSFTDGRYMPVHGGGTMQGPVHVSGAFNIDQGSLYLWANTTPKVGPEIQFYGYNGAWLMGIDVANNGGSRDFVLAAKRTSTGVDDFIYLAHNGDGGPTLGVGMTPPGNTHRLELTAQDSEPQMGSFYIRRTPYQTGDLVTVVDSAGAKRWSLDAGYWLKGANPTTGASVSIKADDTFGRPLIMAKPDGTAMYGFQYLADGSGALALRSFNGSADNLQLTQAGRPVFPNGLTTNSLRVNSSQPPATSSSPCTQGEIAYDTSYVYVCVAADTWKRSALQSW